MAQKPSDNFITPVKVGDTFEDLKRKMIPFGVTKAITSLNSEGIAATLSRQLSLQDVNKIKKENILNAIFDAAAEQPEDNLNAYANRCESANNCSGSSSDIHSYCNVLNYQIEELIPQNMIIECSTRSDIDKRDNEIDIVAESNNDEKNRKKSVNIGVQISLKIVTDGSSKGKEVLDSFLEENSSMKTCCRFIASEMMAKIIDTFRMENDC